MAEYPVRTQIYLSDDQHRALKARAEAEGRSMATLIREAVAAYLAKPGSDADDFDRVAYLNDPIWGIVEAVDKLGDSGVTDGSVNHDRYIYDEE
ncbi:MAG: CopG family transcriptional regulator [Anaerolineae bacterium]